MRIIPLTSVKSQNISVLLGTQNCQVTVSQKGDYVYLSLAVNNAPIINSVICRNLVSLVRYPYLPFVGNLCFMDMQGDSDPNYTGLGNRFKLVYLP